MDKRKQLLKRVEYRVDEAIGTFFKLFAIVLIVGCLGACFGFFPLDKNKEQAKDVDYNPSNDPRIDEMYQQEIEEYEKKREQEEGKKQREEFPVRP